MDFPQVKASAPEIPNIEVIDVIGVGAMSTVYKGRHRLLDQIVALKVVASSAIGDVGLVRFTNEAKRTSSLDHPNIVKVFSSGTATSGDAFIVMEFIQGESLADLISRQGRLSREQLKLVFPAVLSALEYAHEKNLIHRDLKPANIMLIGSGRLSATGMITSAKLVDFGIAKSINREDSLKLTESGFLMGTPNYMSPEQCRDQVLDARSDLYSIGAVLYECLMGEKLFTGETSLDVMYRHLQDKPPIDSNFTKHFGAGLARILNRLLAKNPEQRYRSARDLNEDLMMEFETMPEQDIRVKPQAVKADSKPSILPIVGALLVGLVGGGISGAVLQSKSSSQAPRKEQVLLKGRDASKLNDKLSKFAELKGQAIKHYKHAEDIRALNPKVAFNLYGDSMDEAAGAIHILWSELYEITFLLGLANVKSSEMVNQNPHVKKTLISQGAAELEEARIVANKIWAQQNSKEYTDIFITLMRAKYKNDDYEQLYFMLNQHLTYLKSKFPDSQAYNDILAYKKEYEQLTKERLAKEAKQKVAP